MRKISVIFGTRPEAIKLAPLILALKKHAHFDVHICVTAQHREMLDQVLDIFDIIPDHDLNLMKPNQTLADLTSRAIASIDKYLAKEKPDMVIVQGDTTTVFSATLAAFYNHIAVGHVEAGLRTGNKQSPWPEEANRVLTSHLATLHFAPTENSRQNLLNEGIPLDTIKLTGNTVIDALFMALERIKVDPPHIKGLPDFLQHKTMLNKPDEMKRIVLITGHRRENFGKGFEDICNAIAKLSQQFSDVHFIYPMHMNPNVREPVMRILQQSSHMNPSDTSDGDSQQMFHSNIHLIEPLEYLPFVFLMDQAHVILTDSGGVQEEAPSLGKPVLVMRNTTERPEALDAGTVRLVGTRSEVIIEEVSRLLNDEEAYAEMSYAHNPYGDGQATQRHIQALENFFYGE